ncbi:enoyl-CoA hydratase/isomerase family protein [Actinomycetes bacterium KLBMP 9759]
MIEREDDGCVAVLRLAHGPVSAMDIELCREIDATFHALASEPVRAVVLTGTGPTFSAGVDLRRYLDGGQEYVAAFLPALSAMLRAVFEFPKPLVAAVNGHAIAGGCVLAMCADIRLAAEGPGRIGVPEIKVGVPFPRVPLEVVRYAVGDVTARKLIIGAATHRPEAATALGIVDEVVAPDELQARAVAEALALADDVPGDTFATTKAQLRRDHVERMDRFADEEPGVTNLWNVRAGDGWTEGYLTAVTRR